MSVTHLETVKRKISCQSDETPANKRARQSPSFHACHLTMLQSLHENDNDIDWNQVKLYLKQRPILLQKKREREHLQGIHHEAEKYVKQDNDNNAAKQPLYTTPQQQSPSMFSPLGMSPAGVSGHNARPRRSLALVARLLGRRAASQEGSPFASLLTETNTRVGSLEKALHTLRQERIEKDRKRMAKLLSSDDANGENHGDDCDDSNDYHDTIVKTETKIRLWKMLAHSLRQVT